MSATLSGRRVFLWFAAFFVFIAVINAVMITLALRTHSGLVTDHAYEKGLAYNDTIAKAKAQQALGWKVALTETAGELEVQAVDGAGNPLILDEVSAQLTRPTGQADDNAMAFTADADGAVWRSVRALPANGVWDVRLTLVQGTDRYQHVERVVVE